MLFRSTMAQQSDRNFMMMAAGISERSVELWAAMVHDVRTSSTATGYTAPYLQANLMMGAEGQFDMSDGLSYLTSENYYACLQPSDSENSAGLDPLAQSFKPQGNTLDLGGMLITEASGLNGGDGGDGVKGPGSRAECLD